MRLKGKSLKGTGVTNMSMVKTVGSQDTSTKWWEQKAAATDKKEAAPKHTKSIQTITFNTSSFNDKDRTFVAIASTPVVDRYGDTIMQEGWNLENFLKNPVVPWAHDYWQPPVARVVEIGINEQGNLQFKYQAPPVGVYDFADTIWNLYRNQFMFAFSVGFSSIDAEGDWSTGYEFKECELLEISAVVVPANPQAVALALDKGVIDENQLKGLKSQIADSLKNVDKLLDQHKTVTKTAKVTTEEKIGEHSKSTTVEVTLTDTEAKELVASINKASERLEAATKAAQAPAEGDKTTTETQEEKAEEAKALTTGATVDDTKGMETKAGASLSKANKDKLKAVNVDLEDMVAKCQTHMASIKTMLGSDDEKTADATKTKAADQADETVANAEKPEGDDNKPADKTETAEGDQKQDQQEGDTDAAKSDGEVNSATEASKAKGDEGADHKEAETTATSKEADKAAEDEELVDPDNLTPEQAEKIAAAVNDELGKS